MKAQVLPQRPFPFLLGVFVMLVATPSLVVPFCITPVHVGTEFGLCPDWSMFGTHKCIHLTKEYTYSNLRSSLTKVE